MAFGVAADSDSKIKFWKFLTADPRWRLIFLNVIRSCSKLVLDGFWVRWYLKPGVKFCKFKMASKRWLPKLSNFIGSSWKCICVTYLYTHTHQIHKIQISWKLRYKHHINIHYTVYLISMLYVYKFWKIFIYKNANL